MAVAHVGHIELLVTDLDGSCQFLSEVVGLTVSLRATYAAEGGLVSALPSHPRRTPLSGVGPRQTYTVPRMGFTEEPSRVWEVGEPVPLEIPEPCHEPAVPEYEPARV